MATSRPLAIATIALCLLMTSCFISPMSADPPTQSSYWKLGAGSYGSSSGAEDSWSGMTDLDRARMDWVYVQLGNERTTGATLNRLLKINPRLKILVRLWPIANLGQPQSGHRATFMDYLYAPGVKEKLLQETSNQIHQIMDTIDKPENVVGFTFIEELPTHFTADETSKADDKLPWYFDYYKQQIAAERGGRPITKWDVAARQWWGLKFVQVLNGINSYIKKESGGKLVFAYLQTNHRPLDWLNPGESIASSLVLPFYWRDVIKPGVADGFFAFANNKPVWDRYLKLARDNDWVFFSQLPAPSYRLTSWEEMQQLAKTRDPHNLGYFFYAEGHDRRGEWNDDPAIPLDDNLRRHSVRNRFRQYAAREKLNLELVNANLKPTVEVQYDFTKNEQYYPIIVAIGNVRDRSWYQTPEEAVLRNVKVSLTLPPGLIFEERISIPPTITIDRIEEHDMRTVTFYGTRTGKVTMDHPLTVTVTPNPNRSVS